jgi:hypothetical protein
VRHLDAIAAVPMKREALVAEHADATPIPDTIKDGDVEFYRLMHIHDFYTTG